MTRVRGYRIVGDVITTILYVLMLRVFTYNIVIFIYFSRGRNLDLHLNLDYNDCAYSRSVNFFISIHLFYFARRVVRQNASRIWI